MYIISGYIHDLTGEYIDIKPGQGRQAGSYISLTLTARGSTLIGRI